MDIDPRIGIGRAPPGPQTQATDGNAALGKDEFVRLLMAQLSFQDPTQPQDSTAFVAQLAQFAHVELAQNANAGLEALVIAQAANNQTSVTNLVGKEVVYQADKVEVIAGDGQDGPTTPEVVLDVASAAKTVTVRVLDESGSEVSAQTMFDVSAGRVAVTPMGPDGQPLPPGSYSIEVEALNQSGDAIDVLQSLRGRVTGVSFAAGYPQLLIGKSVLSLADVVEVNEAPRREP